MQEATGGLPPFVEVAHPVDDAAHELAVRIAADAPDQAFAQTERGYRSPFATVNRAVLLRGVTGLVLVGVALRPAA